MVTSKTQGGTSGVGGDDKWWPRTWRRSLVNVITELTERGVRCECRKPGCSCSNDADLILADGSRVCGCCLVDCPDVHHDTDSTGPQLSNSGGHPPFHR